MSSWMSSCKKRRAGKRAGRWKMSESMREGASEREGRGREGGREREIGIGGVERVGERRGKVERERGQ